MSKQQQPEKLEQQRQGREGQGGRGNEQLHQDHQGHQGHQGLFSSMAVRLGEVFLSVGFVLVFFFFFMGILGLSFPEGTGLGDLLNLNDRAALERGGGLDLDLGESEEEFVDVVATLSHVSRKVKDKRAGAISWNEAAMGRSLADRHAVQTFDRSSAVLSFNGQTELQLGENSLIIVRKAEQSRDRRRSRASLVMLDGQLYGKIDGDTSETMELDIVTASAQSRIVSADGSPTGFTINVDGGNSTTFSIHEGSAKIVAGGKTILVPENHALRVDAGDTPGQPVPMPETPSVDEPVDSAIYAFRDSPPDVDFNWEEQPSAPEYAIEVARDPEFLELAYSNTTEETSLHHGALKEGDYYWRVKGERDGVMGTPSEPRSFEVVRDVEPPKLDVQPAPKLVSSATYTLAGATEPGAEVFLGSQQIPVSETGEFEYVVQLQRGLNVIVVESYDSAGNMAHVRNYVNAKF